MPRHDAVAVDAMVGQPEVGGAVGDEPVVLDERPLVEEHVEPFAGRELSLVVLRLDAGRAAPLLRLGAPALEELEFLTHGHGRKTSAR